MSPELTVVVAVQGGAGGLAEVLEALDSQLTEGVEVLVCHAGEETSVPGTCARRPWARAVAGARGALIPELWRDGIDAASGRRVALTVAHCRPGADWVRRMRDADLRRYAGVGGSFANEPGSDGRGWAIFLMRYRRHLPPFAARETTDLAADNVVYDRAALLPLREAWKEGFWENEVHPHLLGAGGRLLLDPGPLVVHASRYTGLGFARQRFLHGVRFGWNRARGMPPLQRLARMLAAPLVPLVFGARIVRESWARRELRRHIPGALPWLVLFLLAWAVGEAWGMRGARAGR